MGTKTITPHAAAIVWNYRDRIAAEGTTTSKVNEVDQIVISTLSLMNISTSKTKSSPQGTFQITLAPTKNWVTVLTPGSWIALLMTQNKIEPKDLPDRKGGGKVDPNKMKFLGRIESVRANVSVNQSTGARETIYVVTGVDWGSVFTTIMYVDPLARDSSGTAIGTSMRFLYETMTLDVTSAELPSSNDNVFSLKNLWGASVKSSEVFTDVKTVAGGEIQVKPDISWVVPDDLVRYLGFVKPVPGRKQQAKNLSDIVEFVGQRVARDGKQVKGDVFDGMYFDKYDEVTEAVGIIQPDSIFGQNQFWQLLQDNCNSTLNEILCDMRWEKNGQLKLALYKRIKPFIFRNNFKGKGAVEGLVSKFTDLRAVEIPLDDILTANAGTNWRDKYNFIEVLFDQSLSKDFRNQVIKSQSQEFDEPAFSREGFRPMMAVSRYVPAGFKDKDADPFAITNWKYLLREWYFNTHVLLNGSMTIIGQNNYIQVGDNILFDGRAVSYQQNTNSDSIKKHKNNDANPVKILAHVESVTHNFAVGANGERTFRTTINFVRGLVVGEDRKPFNDGRLDIDSARITPAQEKNVRGNFANSTENDPDPQKVDGK